VIRSRDRVGESLCTRPLSQPLRQCLLRFVLSSDSNMLPRNMIVPDCGLLGSPSLYERDVPDPHAADSAYSQLDQYRHRDSFGRPAFIDESCRCRSRHALCTNGGRDLGLC
jgi:hypothetical protein